jgi:hypothetical protein
VACQGEGEKKNGGGAEGGRAWTWGVKAKAGAASPETGDLATGAAWLSLVGSA